MQVYCAHKFASRHRIFQSNSGTNSEPRMIFSSIIDSSIHLQSLFWTTAICLKKKKSTLLTINLIMELRYCIKKSIICDTSTLGKQKQKEKKRILFIFFLFHGTQSSSGFQFSTSDSRYFFSQISVQISEAEPYSSLFSMQNDYQMLCDCKLN